MSPTSAPGTCRLRTIDASATRGRYNPTNAAINPPTILGSRVEAASSAAAQLGVCLRARTTAIKNVTAPVTPPQTATATTARPSPMRRPAPSTTKGSPGCLSSRPPSHTAPATQHAARASRASAAPTRSAGVDHLSRAPDLRTRKVRRPSTNWSTIRAGVLTAAAGTTTGGPPSAARADVISRRGVVVRSAGFLASPRRSTASSAAGASVRCGRGLLRCPVMTASVVAPGYGGPPVRHSKSRHARA